MRLSAFTCFGLAGLFLIIAAIPLSIIDRLPRCSCTSARIYDPPADIGADHLRGRYALLDRAFG
ncbi:MAG: hypothetical protein AB7J28_15515 [Hyphomonadaceae bacterium]